MYSLVLLSALAIGLLLLGTTEKMERQIAPLETIKSLQNITNITAQQGTAELDFRWGLLEQSSRDALLRLVREDPRGGASLPEENVLYRAKYYVAEAQDRFYEQVFAKKASITEADINTYVENEFTDAPPQYTYLKPAFINTLKSYFLRATTSTPAPRSTNTGSYASESEISSLTSQYNAKQAEYDRLVDETVKDPTLISANLEKIKALNLEMTQLLNQMIASVSQNETRNNVSDLRDELVYKLQRIQRDYDGLLANTDKLETLRRIRQFEEKDWKRTVLIYLIIFLVLALILLLVMFFRGQKKDMATTTPTMAANTAPLI